MDRIWESIIFVQLLYQVQMVEGCWNVEHIFHSLMLSMRPLGINSKYSRWLNRFILMIFCVVHLLTRLITWLQAWALHKSDIWNYAQLTTSWSWWHQLDVRWTESFLDLKVVHQMNGQIYSGSCYYSNTWLNSLELCKDRTTCFQVW